MRALRRTVVGLAGTALLAGATLFGASPATATALPISQCTTSYGVVLAVDFGHWGGPVLRGCGSTPTTGYALLNQGGWRSTGTHTDGPGFVCRISYSGYRGGAEFPSAAEQDCVHTPPTTAYWLYWHADPGQSSWTYSEDGAQSYSPRPGSVDLWTFGGSGSSPPVSPDAVRAHNSSTGSPSSVPAVHSSAPSGGSPSTSAGGSAGGGASTGPAGQGAGGPAGGSSGQGAAGSATATGAQARFNHAGRGSSGPATRTPGSSGAPASTTAADQTTPAIVNAEPAAVGHSSGSVLPGLVTAALVLTLGAVATVVGRHRRQAR